MMTINIDPLIFSIGHFMLRWYSLIVATAIIVGVWLSAREAERKGFKKIAPFLKSRNSCVPASAADRLYILRFTLS